ncbi:MAG: 3-hydroxy-9,10-secoandrosta-1,3,5(10)-triene-9,17-dione monooxygenase [Myxococcota bacterium]|jgi:3-hydroxy-9,10-secoandrosta-1,3,5(10)-triene-9,17-dione monooxygenase
MSDNALLLIERARALAPLLAEHAEEAERLRRPHDKVIAALKEAEIFKLMVPRSHGGFELDLDTFLEVGLALAEGDASMAWVTTFYIEHCWMFCHFPLEFQEELFAGRGYALAPASIAIGGKAVMVEGGFRLTGRWPWSTGIMHADWVMVSAQVDNPDNEFDIRMMVLRPSEVTVDDVWFVDGMQGTGSNDVVIDSVIVPEAHTTSMLDMVSGKGRASEIHEGPLFHTPMIPILSLAASIPSVGQAKVAVKRFRDRMIERTLYATTTKQSDKPAAQMRLARAELEVRQAELLLRQTVAEVMELRENATTIDRTRWAASFAYVVDQSKRVLQSIAEASGAHAHFQSHPLQRAVRDVNTMACHVVFDLDSRLENHGRAMVGLDTAGMF